MGQQKRPKDASDWSGNLSPFQVFVLVIVAGVALTYFVLRDSSSGLVAGIDPLYAGMAAGSVGVVVILIGYGIGKLRRQSDPASPVITTWEASNGCDQLSRNDNDGSGRHPQNSQ
jgi:hypothetical protein